MKTNRGTGVSILSDKIIILKFQCWVRMTVIVVLLSMYNHAFAEGQMLDGDAGFELSPPDGTFPDIGNWTNSDADGGADACCTTTSAHTGNNGLWGYTGNESWAWWVGPYQEFSSSMGRVYHATAWIRTLPVSVPNSSWVNGSKACIRIVFLNAVKTPLKYYESPAINTQNSPWTAYSITSDPAPMGTVFVRFVCYLSKPQGVSGVSVANFDDCFFEEILNLSPSVETNPATEISPSSALFNGRINPKGKETTVWFEYGTTTDYGYRTSPVQNMGSGTVNISFFNYLKGLISGQVYHYRAAAQNHQGTSYGEDQSLTTAQWPDFPRIAGIDYGPFQDGQNPDLGIYPTPSQIQEDVPILKSLADVVRTYSVTHGLENIAICAEDSNLEMVPGAWLSDNVEENEREIRNLIALTKERRNVKFVIVGCESYLRYEKGWGGGILKTELIAYIDTVRHNVSVPVTTAEPKYIWRENPDLASSVDYICVNIHPYWEGQLVDNAADFVVQNINELKSRYPQKRIIIGETGWPTGGDPQGLAIPSVANQKKFYVDLIERLRINNIDCFYFEAFDEKWKNEPNGVGPHWGLYYSNRTAKHIFGDNLWNIRVNPGDYFHSNEAWVRPWRYDYEDGWGQFQGGYSYEFKWHETLTQNSGNIGGLSWNISPRGDLSISGDRDIQWHAWTYVYVSCPKSIIFNIQPGTSDCVPRSFLNTNFNSPFEFPCTYTLTSGWNRIDITGYNQNQGYSFVLSTELVNCVEIMNSTEFDLPPQSVAAAYHFPRPGWYMVSVPVIPSDSTVSVLFPGALGGMAFIWDAVSGSYAAVTKMSPKKGYWIAIPAPFLCTVTGIPLNNYTEHLPAQGWYMIGSVLGGADFKNPNDNPDGSVLSPAFGWDPVAESYLPTTTLNEKQGYWVAVFGACDLTVGASGGSLAKSGAADKESWSRFSQMFGAQPPVPPDMGLAMEKQSAKPERFALFQNYPNPFNSHTAISFDLPAECRVEMVVYSVMGHEVAILVDQNMPAGSNRVKWDGRNETGMPMPSGLYLCRIKAGEYRAIKKLVLMQ
jgi:exo-beta-1,3-glucanase (GH17 family)